MNETFDAVFQLHESTVRQYVDHFAVDARVDRVLGPDVCPWAGRLLLQTQSNLLFVVVDVQNHHFDFVVDLHHLCWMADTTPAHIGDVQQAVDTAQIHEGSEVGDILDGTLSQLTNLKIGEQRLLHLFAFFFDQTAARNNDVSACFVDLQNHALNFVSDVFCNVVRPPNVDLAGWQKHVDADIDKQTTLDLADDLAFDDIALFVSADDLFPLANAVGFSLGENNQAD